MAARDDVLKVVQQHGAHIAEKNAKAVTALYTSDARAFEFAAPLVITAPMLLDANNIQEWFDTWDGNLEIGARDAVVDVDQTIAHVSQLVSMSGNKKGQGRISMWFRSSVLLKKQGPAWKIAHVHNSVPFSMDGEARALFDLQP